MNILNGWTQKVSLVMSRSQSQEDFKSDLVGMYIRVS